MFELRAQKNDLEETSIKRFSVAFLPLKTNG